MSDGIFTILHLTDLHFTNRASRNGEQKEIIKALLEDIEAQSLSGYKPDIIIFNGDLVNDADEKDVMWSAADEFLLPLLNKTRLNPDRLLIVPGNHDLMREKVKSHSALHRKFATDFKDSDLDQLYNSNDRSAITEKFQRFNEICDVLGASYPGDTCSYRTVELPEFDSAFTLLNTGYTSAGGTKGVNSDDYGKLMIPMSMLRSACADADSSSMSLHFFIGHHPREWFNENLGRQVEKYIQKHYFGHFSGHVHVPDPQNVIAHNGECIRFQGPALHQGMDKWNGYSIARISPKTRHVEITTRTYSARSEKFVLANDIGDDGRFYNSAASRHYWRSRPTIDRVSLARWVADSYHVEFQSKHDSTVIGRSLSEVFYEIPTDYNLPNRSNKVSALATEHSTIDDILKESNNFLIMGDANFGKTTILRRIGISMAERSYDPATLMVPAFISFTDITATGDPVFKAVRSSLTGIPQQFNLRQMLDAGVIAILVDDVDSSDTRRFGSLMDFTKSYPHCRFIFTTRPVRGVLNPGLIPEFDAHVPFTTVRLLPMRASGIRSFTEQYINKHESRDDPRIPEKILLTLKRSALPHTPFSISVLLEVFQDSDSDIQINEATLAERFVEYLLRRERAAEAIRSTFNFDDKVMCLSFVAMHMAKNDAYDLTYDELRNIIASFIKSVGYPQEAKQVLDHFVNQRIFRCGDIGLYRFSMRAFLEYFIAVGMAKDDKFFSWVMDESRYLAFCNEIELFCGIYKNRSDVIDVVSERHRINRIAMRESSPISHELFEGLKFPNSGDNDNGSLDSMRDQMSLPKMTQEQRDDMLEVYDPNYSDDSQIAFRPVNLDFSTRHFMSMMLYSGVLRNLEHLSRENKSEHLKHLMDSWADDLCSSYDVIPALVKHRKVIFNGVVHHLTPQHVMKDDELTRWYMSYLPTGYSMLMKHVLGSPKMMLQIGEDTSGATPVVIKLLRTFLLAELDVSDWITILSDIRQSVRVNPFLSQIILFRINTLLKMRDITKVQTDRLISMAARITSEMASSTREDAERHYNDTVRTLKASMRTIDAKETNRPRIEMGMKTTLRSIEDRTLITCAARDVTTP